MTSIETFLAQLHALDIHLSARDGRLRYDAPQGTLTPELRDELARRKEELLTFLHSRVPLPEVMPDPARRYAPFPLSDIQQAYWLGRSGAFDLGNVASHAYMEFDSAALDVPRLAAAWRQVVARHEMLRAIVLPNGTQHILAQVPDYDIAILNLQGRPPDEVQAELARLRDTYAHQVLPADRWPLFDIRVSRCDGHVRLHVSLDIMMTDLASVARIFAEWAVLYHNLDAPLPLPALSFRDYLLAAQQIRHSELYRRAQAYWQQRLDSLPPAPELPLARNPGLLEYPRFTRRSTYLAPDVWQRFKARAAAAGLTPAVAVLATFAEVMGTWSKNPAFTLNLTLFNRLPLHPQVYEVVGDFTSLTLLAVDQRQPGAFKVRARALQEQLWCDMEHRHYSGVQVLRDLARRRGSGPGALMPVVFTSGIGLPAVTEHDVAALPFGDLVHSVSQTPQVWLDHQAFEQQGGLACNWDGVEALFPAGLLDAMFAAYEGLLKQLAGADECWELPCQPLMPREQLARRALVNTTAAPVSDALLQDGFLSRVHSASNAEAVVTPTRRLTYQQLCTMANQVGHGLRRWGATPNTLVGMVLEKGWEQAVAALGILQAGAAYLPIDPDLPEERRHFLLQHGEVRLVLTSSHLDTALTWPAGMRRLCLDGGALLGERTDPPVPVCHPSDLAYVIFTSGSTGQPKGVMIDHRGAVNTILEINHRFGVEAHDRVLGLSAMSFDLSVYDLFGTLAAGGTLVLPDAAHAKEPAHWATLVAAHGVTVWNSVPALMHMLVDALDSTLEQTCASLRLVMLSGDWIPLDLPERIRALWPRADVISLGGATEASIWSIFHAIEWIEPGWTSVPYGKPLTNQRFHVLNAHLQSRPEWVPGDLYIGGIGLARGYWRDPEKTAAAFIVHPQTGERLYRTGDLGRYLPDGSIEFLGREDFQVKINGFRVELGEIEAALRQYPGIRDVVVQALGDPRSNRKLAAYLIADPQAAHALFAPEAATPAVVARRWHTVCETGHRAAAHLPANPLARRFPVVCADLNQLYVQAVCQAFRELGFFLAPGERASAEELIARGRLAPRYLQWVRRALQTLTAQGWLGREDAVFTSRVSLPETELAALEARLRQVMASAGEYTEAEIDQVVKPAYGLAALLTEQLHSAELYAAEETASLYQRVFPECHAIAGQIVETLVVSLEPHTPLRILEVGAGLGTLTRHLLPLLPVDRTTYCFTDVSDYFLRRARQEFAAYPFVQYALLDLERAPEPQGFVAHGFDLIVAASVLHVPKHTVDGLHHVRTMLAPGGLLLGIEETAFMPFYDLSMGLQQGFDRFEDTDIRPDHPLLTRDGWHRALQDAGFVDTAVFHQTDTLSAALGLEVFLACGPHTVHRFNPAALRAYLADKLPAYMIPPFWMLLERLPLTANGKVDRQALPTPGALQSTSRAHFEPPRNALERQVADLFLETLGGRNVGMHENFFDLGGDSLQATQFVAHLRTHLHYELSLRDFFRAPTVAGVAERLALVRWVTGEAPDTALDREEVRF